MKLNWVKLSEISDYLVIERIKKKFEEGKYEDMKKGLYLFYDYMKRVEKVNILNYLTNLMTYILLWKSENKFQIGEISNKIIREREEISYSYEIIPIVNKDLIKSLWKEAFDDAIENVEIKLGREILIKSIEWDEVFLEEYETEWYKKNYPNEKIKNIFENKKLFLA